MVDEIITRKPYWSSRGMRYDYQKFTERGCEVREKKHSTPYIICAAIWYDDKITTHRHQPKNIKSGYVVTGRRHHNCIAIHSILGALHPPMCAIQGFCLPTIGSLIGWRLAELLLRPDKLKSQPTV
jgi:hypothetical protein